MYTNFDQIKRNIRPGDCKQISEMVGCSYELVQKVVSGERNDKQNILAAFNLLLDTRRKMAKKISTLNEIEND